MALSTVVSYLAGLGLRTWTDPQRRRLCLIAPVTIDLCLLGFFKYANFAMDTANRVAGLLHLPFYLSGPEIILPVGISFYTFHTITYIVDAYRRTITPTRNFFEFSGYSDMAVGLGHLFGLRIPQNFNSPYQALDISDFWRRWHISLSTCLRDYLYIPLGGNRGPRWMAYRNVMITMLLGGLWHGANWTFVAWGGYHGALLMAYRLGRRHWDAAPALLRRAGTFLLVLVGWVFFRSTSFPMAIDWLERMVSWRPAPELSGASLFLLVLAVSAVVAHFGSNTFAMRHQPRPAVAVSLAVLFALCLLVIYGGPRMPFLYFQF